jgi:mannose/fructose/N-acetylgalactosamine-specific phosphotransferase system component IIC
MIATSLALALVAAFFRLDNGILGMNMINRPIVICPVVGLILGDFNTGLIFGATLEMIMMGIVTIGAATPPDTVVSSVISSAFVITAGLEREAAVAIALPVAVLVQMLSMLICTISISFNHYADREAEKGNYKGINLAMLMGAGLSVLSTFVVTFLGVYFGSDFVATIVAAMPEKLLAGIQMAGSLFPALGLALLMNFIYNKNSAPYLFLGFAMSVFFGINMIAITFLAVIVAIILYQREKNVRGA